MASSSSQEEEAALDSLLTRLAMTDEARLEKVLSKLLPLVISRLSTPHEAARKKIIEILTHINKRTRDQHQIKLPLQELYQLFVDPKSAPMVKNFALVYYEMAFERAPPPDKLGVVSGMLTDISTRIPQHQDMLLRMVAKGLEAYGNERGVMEDKFKDKFPFTQKPTDLALFLTFASQSLLYMPPSTGPEGQPVPPPGLSLLQVQRVAGKDGASGEQLATRKLGLLNFIGALELAPKFVYCHCLVASVDSNSRVSRRGEEFLKRKAGNVNLEDKNLVAMLFNTFQGSVAKNLAPEAIVAPASPVLKARLMSSFTRSVAAANCFPSTLQCVFDCIYGPGTTLRLKQAGMEFAVWIFKHASDAELQPMGQAILVGLLKLLGTLDGAEGDAASKQLKAFTYQAIGQLAQRTPKLFSGNTTVAARFFGALRTEPQQLRSQLQEAVMALSAAYEDCSPEIALQIEALLQENMYAEDQARFCAVQWATRLYPMSHAPSRFICILGAGDAKLEIREAAEKGLGLSAREREEAAAQPSAAVTYPSLDAMVCYIAERKPRLPTPSQVGEQALLLPAKTYVAALRFVHECWVSDPGFMVREGGTPEERDISLYQLLLEHAMARDGTTELHALAADGLLELTTSSPEHFAKVYHDRVPWLRQFLSHIDTSTREAFAKIIGLTASNLDAAAASSLLDDLSLIFSDPNKGRFEDLHGAICAVGYIVAQCFSGSPAVPHTTLEALCAKLCSTLGSVSVAGVTAEAIGHIGLRGHLPLPLGNIASAQALPPPTPPSTPSTSAGPLDSTTAPAVQKPADASSLGKKEGEAEKEEEPSRALVLRRLLGLLESKDVKVVVKAVVALGHINYGDPSSEVTDVVLDGLLSLARNKNEDVLFAVGEGLAYIWGGLPSMADKVLRSNFTSLAVSSNFLMAENVTPGDDVAMKDVDVADSRGAARERIIKKLFGELLFSSRKEERCAGAVWLLSLVSYSGRHPKIQSMLPEIQEAFSHLLGDQGELTQEMASHGMSIVYELGDASTKEQLVTALVGTLSGSGAGSKKRAVKLMEETEVFQEGTLGELPGGGGISTYKELCNIANEMGQPDLIYKFMDLANYQASLNSKRGAAFGFAKIAQQAGDAMKPHLGNLVPKLFRYQYDPNRAIQDAMGHIWRALVAEPKKAVDEHFGAIMEDLLKEVGSRLWRSREASCLALIDLIQGRKMSEVGPYLERLWNVAFRAVDDIKETVRKAGDRLSRGVSSLSIRLCDTSLTPQKEAEAAMAVVLPFLLSKGIVSPVSAVRNAAVNSIMKLAKGAGKALKPQLPELVSCMLESLSNLESSQLNYLESHVRGAGISSEKLENVRISMSKDSPMWDTLDYCLQQVDATSLDGLVPKLTQLVRSGVGLNTRVGTAKFISLLAQRREADVRPHVPALLRALFPVVQSERSAAGRKAFAAACASVARFATPARVNKLIEDTARLYTTPGDNESRTASALVLRELSRQAGAALSADATTVIPLSFVGKFDTEEEVARMLGEVWEENTSGQAASLRLYADEIVTLVAEGMTSSSWPRKQQSAKATVALSDGLGEDLAPHAQKLLTGIIAELPGRLWEGKESVLEGLGAVCKSCHAAISKDSSGMTTESIVAALVVACSRRKASYREAAFKCLEQVLKSFKQSELFVHVAPLLLDACTRTPPTPKSTAIGDTDTAKQEEDENPPPPLAPSLDCLAAAWNAATPALVRDSGSQVATAIVIALGSTRPWNARVSALSAAKVFVQKLKRDDPQGPLPQQEDTEYLRTLLPPVLECTEDQKFSQVREASLECMAEVLKATTGGSLLPRDLMDLMQRRFEDLVLDRNATVKSLAMRTRELIENNGAKGPTKMEH